MRCKKHFSDLSSNVGVCASCLRERLFALIAAQAQAQAHAQAQQQAQLSRALSRAAAAAAGPDHDPRKSDSILHPPQPAAPPLAFPRSVSPYVSRRKSDGAATWNNNNGPLEDQYHNRNQNHPHYNLRFYSTPQVGPTSNTSASSVPYKKKRSKFSLFTSLFRSRSEKFESDPRVSYRDSYPTTSSSATATASPSWFSAIFTSRRESKASPAQFYPDESVGPRRRGRTDRGMSPADAPDFDYDYGDDGGDRSPSGSGDSSESSPRWKKTPMVAPPSATRRSTKSGQSRNVSGLAFCLSPLVRASPNRHWNQKVMPPEIGKSGDGRVSGKPHLSTAASFCKNRSRKFADFGRANANR